MDTAVCPGFTAAGVAGGIKKNGKKDLGLIVSETPASVAGMFTTNLVKAAPVLLDLQRIASGACKAIIVNSGNANCCTGEQGMQDAEAMTGFVSSALGIEPDQVLVASTGVIGEPMPMKAVEAATPGLVGTLSKNGFPDLSEAIMTTDTVPKLVTKSRTINGRTVTLITAAKGAGMICPTMATMLCFACTDAECSPEGLASLLKPAVASSFNRITIDGDMSTNDTVLLMANGFSGVNIDKDESARAVFREMLDEAFLEMARWLVEDGEGVTKLVEIEVRGADTVDNARKIADAVANSSLVKTAFFGEDANWGRILGAAGRAGAMLDPEKILLYFDDVLMVENGQGCGKTAEAEATKVLKRKSFTVTLDLCMGSQSASVITCDFSLDYVKINADYRS